MIGSGMLGRRDDREWGVMKDAENRGMLGRKDFGEEVGCWVGSGMLRKRDVRQEGMEEANGEVSGRK